jgi:uncharacterized membrane protein
MQQQRWESVDLLRGLAMVWMTVFHFCFDLANAGLIAQNFYADPFWTLQRTLILSTFLLCAGAGQAIALQQGQTWKRFWRRWMQIAGCALLVSGGSALMFPKSYIYFGVLHGMAVMLLVARLTAGWGRWLWPLGLAAIAMPLIAAHAISTWAELGFLNEKTFNWLGLISAKPIAEDFVPIFPWLGVIWWGMAATQWLIARYPTGGFIAVPQALKPVASLGRWSLVYYMLHQPVLLAGLWVWMKL